MSDELCEEVSSRPEDGRLVEGAEEAVLRGKK